MTAHRKGGISQLVGLRGGCTGGTKSVVDGSKRRIYSKRARGVGVMGGGNPKGRDEWEDFPSGGRN